MMFFIKELLLFNILITAISSSSYNICNYLYYFQNNLVLSQTTATIDQVIYGTVNNLNYDNAKSPTMQVFLISAQTSGNPIINVMNYYTHHIFSQFTSNEAWQTLIMPNNTIYFLGLNKKIINSVTSKGIIQIGNTFTTSIKKFIWANDIQQLIIMKVSPSGIYDQFENSLLTTSDTTYLNNLGTITDIAYDEIHSDLYLTIAMDVFVVDMKNKRIWYRYSSHAAHVKYMLIISSQIPDKFCIITAEDGTGVVKRWQPNYDVKNGTQIYQMTNNTKTCNINPQAVHSIATAYRQEFLIISIFLDASTDTILIMNSDFQTCTTNSFTAAHGSGTSSILIGDIDNTDIFYIYSSDDNVKFRQYSIFAEYPKCVKCQTGSNMWFYSYMYGCSNTCEGVSRKNYPYCEPSCSSQNCIAPCSGIGTECGGCETTAFAYLPLQIGNYYTNCRPRLNCNTLTQFSIDTSNCGACTNAACSSCLSSGTNQCFYCFSPNFFDISSTNCISSCSSPSIALTINSFKLCLPINTCPYGNYTIVGDTSQCTHICNDICETCAYAANNCTSCKGSAILFNNKCYDQCPQGYFYGINNNVSYYQKTCLSCTSTCASCALSCQIFNCLIPLCKICSLANSNTCQTCESNTFNITGQCLASCPIGYHSNYQNYQCEPCISHCISCNNTHTCTQCDETTYLDLNGLCNQCNSSCLGCTNTANNCTLCSNTAYYLERTTGFCMETCNPGFFAKAQVCYSCNMNCSTCLTSATNCKTCKDNLNLLFINTTNEYNCRQCQVSNGYFIPSNNPVMCVSCQSNCKTCNDTITCLECYPNYIITQTNLYPHMTSCYLCNASCLECQTYQYKKCLSCANPLLYADILSGFCLSQCPKNSYLSNANPNQCSLCNAPCTTCLQNANNCTECNSSQFLFINASNSNMGSCLNNCPNTYFMKSDFVAGNVCAQCISYCDQCDNSTGCITCQYGYQNIPNVGCKNNCSSSQYQDSNYNCSSCNESCLLCQTTADYCLGCVTGQGLLFYESTHSCYNTCPPGSYALNSTICASCDPYTCETCEYDSHNCTSCFNKSLTLVANQCILQCLQGSYKYLDQCLNCNSGCAICSSPSNCTECATGYYLYAKDGYCVNMCPTGYYETANKTCDKCPNLCDNCNNSETCNICTSPYYLDDNLYCMPFCLDYEFSYIDDMDRQRCKSCSDNCATCSLNETYCDSCVKGLYLKPLIYDVYSICVSNCTEDGYFLSITPERNGTCNYCGDNCKVCQSDTVCKLCEDGYRLDNALTHCINNPCPQYFFLINQTCQSCNINQFYYEISDSTYQCIDNCSMGNYPYLDPQLSRSFCQKCPLTCSKCISFTHCMDCTNGYTLASNNTCILSCPIGQFLSTNDQCLSCNSSCSLCYKSADNCTTCPNASIISKQNPILYNYSCLSCDSNCFSCQNTTYNCTSCKFGFVLKNNICISSLCPVNCLLCSISNLSVCIQCPTYQFLYNNTCLSDCPNKTYPLILSSSANKSQIQNNICLDCVDPHCQTCGSETSCLTCQPPYILNQNKCDINCPIGAYYNSILTGCNNCNYNCSSCYGPGNDNCLTCIDGFYLKGTVCLQTPSCGAGAGKCQTSIDISLVKSAFIPSNFYIIFSQPVDIPNYVNLTELININITGVDKSAFTYSVNTVNGKPSSLLVNLTVNSSIKNPLVSVNFTDYAYKYVKGAYNTSFILNTTSNASNVFNLTLDSILVSPESPDTIDTKKKITYDSFISFSYLLLSFSIGTYILNTKRMSIFWYFTDFIQLVSLMIFLTLNYDDRFIAFLQLLFVYHANFIAFLGKSVNEITGQVLYFGYVMNSDFQTISNGGNFVKFLGTGCFIANGLNAFLYIVIINLSIILLKFILKLHEKYSISDESAGFFWIVKYFYDRVLFSILIRAVQFFFYLIILSVFIQFYSIDMTNESNKYGILTSVLALMYYIAFFVWLSKTIVNNPAVYESKENRENYESIFHDIEVKYFIQRNHFILTHIKKFIIVIAMTLMLKNVNGFVSLLIVLQVASAMRYVKYRPFQSHKMNLLNFLTEVFLMTIFATLLKISDNTNSQQDGDVIISVDSVSSTIQAGDAIISLCFIVLVMFTVVAFILALYYIGKNIECLCFFFVHRKIPDEEEVTILEKLEKHASSSIDQEDSKFKIPHKRDLREIALEEEQKKRDIQDYKKKHIVQVE